MVKLLTSESYVQKDKESENPFAVPKKKDRCDWEKGELKGYTDTYYVDGYGREELPECYEALLVSDLPLCKTGNRHPKRTSYYKKI